MTTLRNLAGALGALSLLLAVLLLGSCAVEEVPGEDTLTVSLSDSLAKYDSIRIILSAGGTATDSLTTKAPYPAAENGRFKVVMTPGSKPPGTFTLSFVVFSAGVPTARYKVEVTPEGASKPQRVDGGNGGDKRPESVEIVTVSPLTLIEKGLSRTLEARVLPAGADQGLAWRSLDTGFAKVDADGKVTPGKAGETEIVATSKVDGSLSDRITVKVQAAQTIEGIRLSPSKLTLYVGGEAGLTKAAFLPAGAVSAPVFASDDTGKAVVGADGRVTAKSAGEVAIRAHPEGFPNLIAQCTVTVILDKPVLDVGNDRKASPGQEVAFPIKVTQQYGKVAALKWDLDGDGKWDADSTTQDQAEPKHTYDDSRKEVTVSFYVRDTEGNRDSVSRKVLIGSAAPLVEIIRPRVADTVVNVTPFVVEFLVDNQKKTKSFDLKEGPNEVEVSETNDGGTGRDEVNITLDTKAPEVKITAPARGLLTREATVAVAWSLDGVPQTARLVENLVGKQGPIVIRRDHKDEAGNEGFDTLTLFRDIDPPAAPRFAATTTPSPTKIRRPTWHWALEGAARFGVALGSAAPVEGTATSFTPDRDLSDGDHTLSVYAVDAAGNKGPVATHRIRVQTKGPRVAITSPANGLVTKAQSVAVAWTVDDVAQTTQTSEDLRGKQGEIKIRREATDSAGNRVADSITLVRDTIAPPAPGFTAQPPAAVNASHTAPIQWTWNRHGTASDTFLVSLNGGDPVRQTGTSYTLSNAVNQTYFFEVREKDAAGNESEPAKDTVVVDRVAPPAPVVGGTTPTATPTWTWTRAPNSDGSGRFRYRYSTQATYSAETAATSFAPTGLASGSHTLMVQERDAAGNWSSDGQATLVVDRTGPSLAIATPTAFGRVSSVNVSLTGTVTDPNGPLRVEYRLGSGAYNAVTTTGGNWIFSASYVDGANTVWIRAEDGLGNRDSITTTLHKLPNVIFVRKGMSGTGKSWDDAYGELHQALDTNKVLAAGTEIWVTEGRYNGAPPNGSLYLQYGNVKVYGGFPTTRAASDTGGRNFALNATRLANSLHIGKSTSPTLLNNIVIDGFTLTAEPLLPPQGGGPKGGISANGKIGTLTLRNLKASNIEGGISVIGQRLSLENSEFDGLGNWGPPFSFEAVTNIRNVKFVKISTGGQFPFQYTSMLNIDDSHIECFPGAASGHAFLVTTNLTLTINNSKVQFGKAGIFQAGPPPQGTLNYNANNTTIP